MPAPDANTPLSVSIIIPTKNRPDDLTESIRSILGQSVLPAQLIIVDQSATGESQQRVTALVHDASLNRTVSTDLVYIRDTSITGAATARNRAMELATSEVVLFLDDDVELEPAFVEEILSAYRRLPQASGVSGIVTNYCPPPFLLRWWTRIFERGPFHDDRQPIYWSSRALLDHAPLRVTRFGGGLMSFRRSAITGVAFDDKLSGASEGEDVDFCMHLSPAAVLCIAPRARLVHKQTLVSRSTQHWLYLHVRTNWYLYRRNWDHGICNRLCLLWLNVGYCLAALLTSTRQLSRLAWKSVFRGIVDGQKLCAGFGLPGRTSSTETVNSSYLR
jgi:GT2 family glycosyltransferase